MEEYEENDAKIYAECRKFDVNIREEASLILWRIWRFTRPQYSTQPTCLDALNDNPGLYDSLKEAHNTRSYCAIQNWTDLPGALPCHIEETSIVGVIQDLLEGLEQSLTRVITGDTSLPVWSSKDVQVDQNVCLHLKNLKIPTVTGKPSLLLHERGSFKNDSVLKSRIDNVFMPNNHTFLVNTSGSGKTRLLLEGLCNKWGFYFTSMVDSSSIGSSDVQNSIRQYVPNSPNFRLNLPTSDDASYNPALKNNRAISSRIFSQVLLARLIIFYHFAEIMEVKKDSNSPLNIYQERWLLLQLQPQLAHPTLWDIFDTLSCRLSEASDNFISSQTHLLLDRVRQLCSIKKLDSNAEEIPFFCVLDEAQYSATQLTTSFRSDQNGAPRPILREIVRTWEEQTLGKGVFMVVAGTGISKDIVDQTMSSAIMKDSKYRWCSDTGAFDTMEAQQKYLTKYLPQSLIQSATGKRLLDRAWYWLRGRHRLTTGYVTELIRNDFQKPHRLLNAYIEHFTGFSITDAYKYVTQEDQGELPKFSPNALNFSKLQKNNGMLSTIHQIITQYMMRSTILRLGTDEAMYVEYGFARFSDSEAQVAMIDEPLILLAAIRWMNNAHLSCYKLLSRDISQNEPNFSNGFETYIVFCLDMIFSQNRPLTKIFNFVGTAPTWANMEAKLVSLYHPGSGEVEASFVSFAHSRTPSATLGMNTKSPDLTISWLNHLQRPSFCFPHQSMGPDVIFVLQLSDKSHIWVVLQVKWSKPKGREEKLSKKLVLDALNSVTPDKFFLHKNNVPFSPTTNPELRNNLFKSLLELPNRRTDVGKYSLLRVVASFPARPRLERYAERDPDEEGHPIATLNMDLVKKVTEKLSPHSFLEALQTEQGLKQNTKEKRKRKKTNEEDTVVVPRRKRLKI